MGSLAKRVLGRLLAVVIAALAVPWVISDVVSSTSLEPSGQALSFEELTRIFLSELPPGHPVGTTWLSATVASFLRVLLPTTLGWGLLWQAFPLVATKRGGVYALDLVGFAAALFLATPFVVVLHLSVRYGIDDLPKIVIGFLVTASLALTSLRAASRSLPREVEDAASLEGMSRGRAMRFGLWQAKRHEIRTSVGQTLYILWGEMLLLEARGARVGVGVALDGAFRTSRLEVQALSAAVVVSISVMLAWNGDEQD